MGVLNKLGSASKKVVTGPVGYAKRLMGIDHAKENLSWMATWAKAMLPSSIKKGRIETFERAMARQGVSEEELDKIYTNYVLKFWIGGMMLALGLAVAINYVIAGSHMVIFPTLGFSAICLSQMFIGSFRARQLGRREFSDVSEWLANPSSWVPTSFIIPPPPRGAVGLAKGPAKNVAQKSAMRDKRPGE